MKVSEMDAKVSSLLSKATLTPNAAIKFAADKAAEKAKADAVANAAKGKQGNAPERVDEKATSDKTKDSVSLSKKLSQQSNTTAANAASGQKINTAEAAQKQLHATKLLINQQHEKARLAQANLSAAAVRNFFQ